MTHAFDYPQPPYDAVMPATVQLITLWVGAIILAGFVVAAIVQSRRHKTVLPLLFLVAGFCTIPLEPLVTYLGHAFHPEIGQIRIFKPSDRALPWHAPIIYAFYFGGVYMFMLRRMIDDSFTVSFVWKTYFVLCVLAYLLELAPVQTGLWLYYGHQALWLWKGGMPLFWTFVNSASIISGLTLIKLVYPVLTGWKRPLVILLSPIGVIMGHFGAGFAYYNIVNSPAGPLLIQLSGLLSVASALIIVWICARLLAAPTHRILFSEYVRGS